jgi:hypothetical protein
VDEVVERLTKTRDACKRLGGELAREFKLDAAAPPVNAFTWCFNSATLALETCSFYAETFERQSATSAGAVALARQQNGERVVMQTKAHFLFALSSMEAATRQATEKYSNAVPLDKTKKWQYLAGILGKSHALGLIDDSTKRLWDGLIFVRNTIVHNNGVASEDFDFAYPNGTTLSLRKDAMIQGTVGTFAELTEWAVENYALWCGEFLKRATC